MEETKVKITVTFVPFGVLAIQDYLIDAGSADEIDYGAPPKPIYSFPSQTVRIEPAVLASNDIQVL